VSQDPKGPIDGDTPRDIRDDASDDAPGDNPDDAPSVTREPPPHEVRRVRPSRRWKNPDSKVELILLGLAALSLGAGLAMWSLDVERPGVIEERPVVSALDGCSYEADEGAVVVPYEVSGSNDGEVWLRVRAQVQGPETQEAHAEGMLTPDGEYTMRGDVTVPVQTEPASAEALSCTLTVRRWE
jgi:hypothetical protein